MTILCFLYIPTFIIFNSLIDVITFISDIISEKYKFSWNFIKNLQITRNKYMEEFSMQVKLVEVMLK